MKSCRFIQVFEGGAGEKAGVRAGFVFQSLEGLEGFGIRSKLGKGSGNRSTGPLAIGPRIMVDYLDEGIRKCMGFTSQKPEASQ